MLTVTICASFLSIFLMYSSKSRKKTNNKKLMTLKNI